MLANFVAPYDAHVVERLDARRHRAARQDQHGRVRDGLVERELVLRPGAQSLGPDARARRLLGRLGGGRRRAPGARGHRHRHRRLDPPAGGALRRLRPEADLRRRVALRHDRLRLHPRPGRAARAERRGPRAAAERHGRLRCARLDQSLDRPAEDYTRDLRDAGASRSRDCASACRKEYFGEGLDAGRGRGDRGGARRIAQARREAVEVACPTRALGAGLLRDRAGRGLVEPVALRRRALRPPRARIRRPARHVPEDARRGLRRRGEAAHPGRHLRALARLLRRVLPEGAADPPADRRRFRRAFEQLRRDHRARPRRPSRSSSARRPTTRCRCT